MGKKFDIAEKPPQPEEPAIPPRPGRPGRSGSYLSFSFLFTHNNCAYLTVSDKKF